MAKTSSGPKDTFKVRLNRFVRHISIFFRLPKVRVPRLNLSRLFRQSKTADPSRKRIGNVFHHIRLVLRYPTNKTPNQKSQHTILNALSKPPRFSLLNLRQFFRRLKIYLYFFFKRSAKTNSEPAGAAKFYQMSFSQRLLLDLRKNLNHYFYFLAPPIRQHWKSVAVLVAFSPLLFEAFLQGSSLLTWSMLQLRSNIVPARQNVVLCVGDTFTSGVFTSRKIQPYTDFLQQLSPRRVVNYSSEFLNSLRLLETLPSLLQKQQPVVVYIMLGINDFLNSNSTETIQVRETPHESQRYIRTAIVLQKWKDQGPVTALLDTLIAPAPFFLKTPEEDKRSINLSNSDFYRLLANSGTNPSFPVDKRFYFQQGALLFNSKGELEKQKRLIRYSIKGNVLFQESNGAKSAQIWKWKDGLLVVAGERIQDLNLYTEDEHELDPLFFTERNPQELFAWNQLEMGSMELAQSSFLNEIKSNVDVFSHAGLAELYFNTGSHAEANKQIAWLVSKYQTHPNPKSARALLLAYGLENSVIENLRMTITVLKQFPSDPWIWKIFAWNAYLSGRPDFALPAIDKALELAPQEMPGLRSEILKTKSEILISKDAEASLEILIESFLLDGNEDAFVDFLQRGYTAYKTLNPQKALGAISCPPEKKPLVLNLMDQGLDPNLAGKVTAFRLQLREIARVCQQYGAHPVFVTYPLPYPIVESTMRQIAEETDAGWLNLSYRFESLLKDPVRRKKIQQEGSFTDGASQKMAEAVAEDLEYRLHD